MVQTFEDLDRRVTALELVQSARGENAIARVEQKVDALHRVTAELIAGTEQRLRAKITESELRMGARITAVEQGIGRLDDRITEVEQGIGRLDNRIGATERRFVDLLNERFDAVMVALDRLQSPPKG
jgi:predicted  nucleic acid-binding Zn-ribbon protein